MTIALFLTMLESYDMSRGETIHDSPLFKTNVYSISYGMLKTMVQTKSVVYNVMLKRRRIA